MPGGHTQSAKNIPLVHAESLRYLLVPHLQIDGSE